MVSLRSAIILSQTFDPDAPKQGCKEGGGEVDEGAGKAAEANGVG